MLPEIPRILILSFVITVLVSAERPRVVDAPHHHQPLSGQLLPALEIPRCDVIHQAWRQAIVWIEMTLSKFGPKLVHLVGIESAFDDRGYERRKGGRWPTLFGEPFRMDE